VCMYITQNNEERSFATNNVMEIKSG
jgi:hypothetical protein